MIYTAYSGRTQMSKSIHRYYRADCLIAAQATLPRAADEAQRPARFGQVIAGRES